MLLRLLPQQVLSLFSLISSRLVCLLIAILIDHWSHDGLGLSLRRVLDARLRRAVFPLGELSFVCGQVLGLELSHLLNLVEVDDEAPLIGVLKLDALAAEDGPVIRAVEVHDAVVVRSAKFVCNCLGRLIIVVDLTQQGVPLNYLV